MSNNFWEQQSENDEFRDVPDEVNGNPAQGAPPIHEPKHAPAPKSAVKEEIPSPEELAEQVAMSEDEEEIDNQSVLSDARLRLEQGRLYEMVMTSNLFDSLEADPQAIKNVQRELKKFAKERMEVMLGMRTEKVAEATIVSSPFNDLEVTVLKKLASAATKGLSESPEANQIAAAPRKQSLTPITQGASKKIVSTKPLAARGAPISRREASKKVIPQIPFEPEGFKPLEKDPAEMNKDELDEYNKGAAARQAGKRAPRQPNAIPPPTPDQEEMIHTQRARDNAESSLSKNPAVAAIAAAMLNRK